MMRYMSFHRAFVQLASLTLVFSGVALCQSVDVVAQVQITHSGSQRAVSRSQSSGVVVWLNQVSPDPTNPPAVARPGHFRLAQKDKSFHPHLLVIPLDSSVDFPNLDPFFHNVFSQFNGKRFDLGLYEAGSTKTVHFDHEGVSYIFCNIHPEMSAVVIALATPYVAVSSDSGGIILHNVPVGTYQMRVWAEGVDANQLDALTRRVRVSPSQANLGSIQLVKDEITKPHKNKFGEDYKPDKSTVY